MKALILDLEEDILELLAYNLEKAGFETLALWDEALVLNTAMHQVPDLILIGNCSSDDARIDLVRALRALPVLRKSIIIFLSTQPLSEDDPMCHKAGADGCIQTPVLPRDLIAYIRQIDPAFAA